MAVTRKPDIVQALREVGFTHKDANLAYDTVFESIEQSIANGDSVKLTGFGSFTTYVRAGMTREVFGKEQVIPPATLPKFKAGARLKEAAAVA